MQDEFKDMIEKYKTELMNYRSNHRQTAPTVKNGTALSVGAAPSPEGTPSTAPKMPPMPPQNVPEVPIIPGEPLETQPPIEMPQPQPQESPVHRENANNMSGFQHSDMNSVQQEQSQANQQQSNQQSNWQEQANQQQWANQQSNWQEQANQQQWANQQQSNWQEQTIQPDGLTDRQNSANLQNTEQRFTQQQNPTRAEAQIDTRTQLEMTPDARSEMQPQASQQNDLPPIRPNEVEIVPGTPSQPQQIESQQPPTVITAEEQAQSQQDQAQQGVNQGQSESQTQSASQPNDQFGTQSENPNQSDDDEGYFQARVVTADGAFPVQNALVVVTLVDGQSIVSQMRTNIDGVTRSVSLPAVSRKLSEQPGDVRPFDVYNVEILADGYLPFQSENVPIFGGITNVQTISLIPRSEFGTNQTQTAQNTEPNL